MIIGFALMTLLISLVGLINSANDLGGIMIMVDVPSILFITVPLVIFSQITGSGKLFRNYIFNSFRREHKFTKAELDGLICAVNGNIKFVLATGLVVFLASSISGTLPSMFLEYGSEFSAMNLAVSTISLVYAIGTAFFILFPVKVWAENKVKQQ